MFKLIGKKKDISAEPPFSEHIGTANTEDHPPFGFSPSLQSAVSRIQRIGKVRGYVAPEELGTLAAINVLTQYRAAKAETTIRWWKSPALALSSMYALLTVGAPAAGLSVSLAIDVAIFGGAAEDLMKVNPMYQALAVGSMVFAVGIGISKKYAKIPLTAFMLAASMGASVLVSDNEKFKEHFANILPESMRETTYAATANVDIARASVESWNKALNDDTYQLYHGGVGNAPILSDYYNGNDAQGIQLLNVTIPHDQDELRAANENLNRLSAQANQLNHESLANWYGRLIGAGYLFLWLGASQIVAAAVIGSAPDILSKQRENAARHKAKLVHLHDIHDPQTMGATVTADVGNMLMYFSEGLANVADDNVEKQNNLGASFRGEAFQKATQIGVDIVCGALRPVKNWRAESGKQAAPAP